MKTLAGSLGLIGHWTLLALIALLVPGCQAMDGNQVTGADQRSLYPEKAQISADSNETQKLLQETALPNEPAATKPLAFAKRPEAPSLLHEVHEVDVTRNPDGSILRTAPQYYRPIRPAIPAVRTTHDGRLAFNWSNHHLYLLSPEKITRPFPFSDPGLEILTNLDGWYSHVYYYLSKPTDPSESGLAGAIFCNPVKREEQPRQCGSNDCYDVTYMGFRTFRSPENNKSTFDKGYFRSRRMIIEVENPKTPQARVRDIRPAPGEEIHEKAQPIEIDYKMSDFSFMSFEPLATTDGHLYASRMSFVPVKNIDGDATVGRKNVDIYYMVSPKEAAPCDASAFSYIKRIQKAPTDPDMRDPVTGKPRYGIAEYAMRDSFGKLIPEDAEFPTYPWLDREGNNLFFASGGSTLFSYNGNSHQIPTLEPERSEREADMIPNSSRYPARCIEGVSNCAESPYNPEQPEHIRGVTVLGSWTHGKAIVLDGMINHIDYGLRRGLQFQRELQLYQPAGTFDGWVRAAAGRSTGGAGSGIDNQLESYSENDEIHGMSQTANVVDSLENVFNAYRHLRPTLPRDVVWTVNNSAGSDEVAFDDYMDSRALIVSSMIPGAEFVDPANVRYSYWDYRDGFGYVGGGKPDQQNRPILIQNAATSTELPVPRYGYLNTGRSEPVALGGIHGRGLWLDGNNSLRYEFPKAVTGTELFLSIFFDSRSPNENLRQLFAFPDDTRVLVNTSKIRVKKAKEVYEVPVNSQKNAWTHLGIAVSADGKTVSFYINGMKKQTLTTKSKFFVIKSPAANGKIVLRAGRISADDATVGFRGWIDELKLFAYIPTSEVICNHAYGSMHWVGNNATSEWQKVAAGYPEASHQEIGRQLPESYLRDNRIPQDARFVCAVDYRDSMGIYRSRMHESDGLLALRDALLFAVPRSGGGYADGRVFWNANRTDYRANAFCLSCHTPAERRGLTLAALEPGQNCAMFDRRRQPLQSPLFLAGQQTEAQLVSVAPNHAQLPKMVDHRSGALLADPLVLPSLNGGNSCVSPTDEF
jgi:hypothetical protein